MMYNMTNEERLSSTIIDLHKDKEILTWKRKLDPTQPLLNFFDIKKSNEAYIQAELAWYLSQDRDISFIKQYASLWEKVCDKQGQVNSNYGWCIYSPENGSQFSNVVAKLCIDKNSRQGSMIYTRPTIHDEAGNDFICTNYAQVRIKDDLLHYTVHQRSCDFVYGFFNDFAWHCHVYEELYEQLRQKYPELKRTLMGYICDSLHIYPKHYDLIAKIAERLMK